MEIFATLLQIIAETINIYLLLLFVRVILTWFPNLDMSNPVLSTLASITDPYLNAFRGIIPPLGGIDISPILGFFLLRFLMDQLFINSYKIASLAFS